MEKQPIDIDRLKDMPRKAFDQLWRREFGKPSPFRLRRELKIPILAARIQERRHGGLSPAAKARLARISSALNRGQIVEELTKPQIKPGTRIVREWHGQTHVVVALSDHYEYRGERFQSLSEIARRITGTRWSGPRFFGLKKTGAANGRR
jgi:hypothetical protein